MKTLLIRGIIVCLSFLSFAYADAVPKGKSVVVMPLRYSYQVTREFYDEYARAESSLKGYAKESSSASYRENSRDGYYSSSGSASARSNSDGKYDLKRKSEAEYHSSNDKVIVEKSLDSEKLTGIIESSLSEAGVKLGTRGQATKAKGNVKHLGDYILTGDITSMRLGGIRKVPDGTNRRYAVDATCRINIKITRASDGQSTFARTFVGKGIKTFDATDYIPTEEVIEMAVDEVAMQITEVVSGERGMKRSESDEEYRDSPGKRLRE